MAGRKPKPTAIKKLEGNPGKRKLNRKEPVPAKGMPECPEWLLPEAKVEWERLCVKPSDMGVLTEIDMAAFAAYCQSFARWKEAQEHADIAELEQKLKAAETVKDDSLSQALGTMKKYSEADELTQAMVQELIEKVVVTDLEHVEIVWKFKDEVRKFIGI